MLTFEIRSYSREALSWNRNWQIFFIVPSLVSTLGLSWDSYVLGTSDEMVGLGICRHLLAWADLPGLKESAWARKEQKWRMAWCQSQITVPGRAQDSWNIGDVFVRGGIWVRVHVGGMCQRPAGVEKTSPWAPGRLNCEHMGLAPSLILSQPQRLVQRHSRRIYRGLGPCISRGE